MSGHTKTTGWCMAAKAFSAALVFACLLRPQIASAYVRTTTKNGTPIAWHRSCVFVTPDGRGSTDVSLTESAMAIQQAARAWNEGADECGGFIEILLEEPISEASRGFTTKGLNRNVVVWLEDRWGDSDTDYDPSAVALTTITFISDTDSAEDGKILDADIELNGVDHEFSTDPTGAYAKYDIQNTLTHEMGHLLGLDHPCYDGAVDPRPVDDEGEPIPNCRPSFQLPEEVIESTMYNFAIPGETKKRTLEPDDKEAVCDIYPLEEDPNLCEPVRFEPDGCECSSTSKPGSLPFGVLLALICLAAGSAWRKRHLERARLSSSRRRDR